MADDADKVKLVNLTGRIAYHRERIDHFADRHETAEAAAHVLMHEFYLAEADRLREKMGL